MPGQFKYLSMMDLRKSPGSIRDRVSRDGESFIIERNGQEKAFLVPISVFWPDIQQRRITKEINELLKKGIEPQMTISDSKEMEMRFHESVGDNQITLTIVLSHGYPNVAPKVYAAPLADNVPHRWQDGALCILGTMSAWNPGKHTIAFLHSLARQWLANYHQWLETGQWADQEGKDS